MIFGGKTEVVDGSSKGLGIVVFENPRDAQKAVRATNNVDFGGRALEVRYH
jgi:RNA recognition motif-containing protein